MFPFSFFPRDVLPVQHTDDNLRFQLCNIDLYMVKLRCKWINTLKSSTYEAYL